MKIIPESYHVVIMRSSGGGAPVTVPSRWIKRLWVTFLALVVLLVVLSLALGFTVHRLNQRQAMLKARQAEVKELYINLARQNEQLINLKKLVPPASALYLESLQQPAARSAPVESAAPASPKPVASLTPQPAAPPAVRPPVAAPPAPSPPPAAATLVVQARPTQVEQVKLTDLKLAGDQLSLRLKRATGEVATGYLVAVFSAGPSFASYPEVGLRHGVPVQGRQGLDFNVRNYRLISFKIPLSNWSRLTFYVYDVQGRLKQRLALTREQIK